MGLLDDIKNDVQKSGTNKRKFIYFKAGTKVRVRFLQDMEDGLKVVFHDSFANSINVPCQETFGRDCTYCEDESLRTRDQYIWCVWNYDAKEVQLFMFPVNQCSPVPGLVSLYEAYGTLTDRDFVITKQGQQQSTTYSIVPMDKVKFKNTKAKPFSKSKVLSLLDKAFPADNSSDDDDDEDEDEIQSRRKTRSKSKTKRHHDPEPEDEEDEEDDMDEDDDESDDDSESDYESMSARELYDECLDRGIKVKPRKPSGFYIKLLKQDDNSDDEEEDEEEDDWDE